ncbi:UDP-galactose phosphate transferase [Companilactobacillus sp. RD055328]|uniref:sugar transferase n=1 Tax=Companilactobacillus sp. RD055328 TaxID=2916634 RepID=UPI001FC83714|nr:sugar transferase [Companilactobacillus sp. RD055328]GKQ43364.1 UDP-galactose phosphate transferase [Companilactobacillus sp. RD055328]
MLKRFLDLILSFLLLIVLSPVILIEAIVIAFKFKENPIFISTRSGKDGKPFKIIKFKSMRTLYDNNGELLSDEERITSFGILLRSSSLDELPQLVNVFLGEMSLVGPRPLNASYLDRYTDEQRRRLEVRPGITGWAQVNGRNTISWERKFELDCYYVDHQSFILDSKILLLTILKVITREGISQNGFINATSFKGKNSKA